MADHYYFDNAFQNSVCRELNFNDVNNVFPIQRISTYLLTLTTYTTLITYTTLTTLTAFFRYNFFYVNNVFPIHIAF